MFGNKDLRRISEPKKEDIIVQRKLHNNKLNNLFSSPDFISVIKPRRLERVGHVGMCERNEKCIKMYTWITSMFEDMTWSQLLQAVINMIIFVLSSEKDIS